MPNINDIETKKSNNNAQSSSRKWRPKEGPLVPVSSSIQVEGRTLNLKDAEANLEKQSPLLSSKLGPDGFVEPEVLTPIPSSEFKGNLGYTHEKPRYNLDNTQVIPSQNLGITAPSVIEQPLENPKERADKEEANIQVIPRYNPDKTQLSQTDNLDKTEVIPSGKTRQETQQNLGITQVQQIEPVRFSSLVGLQRKLTLFLYSETVRVRDKITDSITGEHLAETCQAHIMTVQSAVKELIRKQIIKRAEFKNGRGGWTRYEMSEHIFNEITSLEKKHPETFQNLGIIPVKPRHKSSYDRSSSSSLLNIPKTTSSEPIPDKDDLPPEWEEIDYSDLASISFGRSDLVKVVKSYKSNDDLVQLAQTAQRSIEAMANDIATGHAKRHKNPRAVLYRNLLDGTEYGAVDPNYVPSWLREQRRSAEVLRRNLKEAEALEKEKQELQASVSPGLTSPNQAEYLAWRQSKAPEFIAAILGKFTEDSRIGKEILIAAFKKASSTMAQEPLTQEKARAIADAQFGPSN